MAILMILPMSILTIRHRRLAWTIGRRLTAARWRPGLSLKEWVEPLPHATQATHQQPTKGSGEQEFRTPMGLRSEGPTENKLASLVDAKAI